MEKQQLEELLKDMSLQEKVDQMLQITGRFYQMDINSVLTGPALQMGLIESDINMAGSILGTYGAKELKQIQKTYMEQHPHHIPMLFMMDIIHGMKTIFPMPLAMGASFEPELVRRCAQASAKEAAYSGLHVTFSPMVDLVRDARWGRVMESTGEDPYLNSRMAEAQVRGFQGESMSEEGRVCACVKHFAGYGAAVAGREYSAAELSERTLRQYYFPAYKAGIDAGAGMVMTAFNTIDNIPATANRWLMRDILRGEMGFGGVLISDFSAILETVVHGYAEDKKDAAKKAVEAGVDIDMMTGCYSENLAELVEQGIVPESLVDECVWRILDLKNKLGLFDNPYKDADEAKAEEVILCREHRALAREAAGKSCVLLKNENILPLNKEKKIAFIGPYTYCKKIISNWSVAGESKDCVSVKEAADEIFDSIHTSYHAGSQMTGRKVRFEGFSAFGKAAEPDDEEWGEEKERKELEEAVRAAKEAEIVVLSVGESYLHSGEACSRAFLDIPEVQMNLFRRIAEVNPNIVVVLFNGRPLDIREISAKSKALLVAWMPGTEGGHGIVDVLTGKVNPSGKLPMSFPYCVGQCPVFYNELSTGRPYREGDTNRYFSKYLDIPNKPLYPFGYGLSYSEFEISPVKLNKNSFCEGDVITASVTVKNTGEFPGTEVIQLYVQDVAASVARPVKELKGFEKVTLRESEEAVVSFRIDETMLSFIRADGTVGCEPGLFRIWVGNSSETSNMAEFWLTK
ncbi:MAG: beta-glucosidase BglX [Acetatifactor sp.]|nr:beta-glucosidase BglX [Acetatifactor sp.]